MKNFFRISKGKWTKIIAQNVQIFTKFMQSQTLHSKIYRIIDFHGIQSGSGSFVFFFEIFLFLFFFGLFRDFFLDKDRFFWTIKTKNTKKLNKSCYMQCKRKKNSNEKLHKTFRAYVLVFGSSNHRCHYYTSGECLLKKKKSTTVDIKNAMESYYELGFILEASLMISAF